MRPVRGRRIGRPAAGFTLVESVIALVIMAILLAVGVPRMSDWLLARKAATAAIFYKEAFQFARAQAVSHNSASRLVLLENTNGQMDWQVDICYPTGNQPCDEDGGAWSTVSAAAAGDPDQARGYRSVVRRADALPDSSIMRQTLDPSGATEVYFTPLGWVDGTVPQRLMRVGLLPAIGREGLFRPQAVVLTLAGTATICDPAVARPDSRGCP